MLIFISSLHWQSFKFLTFRRVEVYQCNIPAILFFFLETCICVSHFLRHCWCVPWGWSCVSARDRRLFLAEVLELWWVQLRALTSPVAPLLLFCTTSEVMLGLLIWLVYLQPPALLFFFLFYFLEVQSETGERGVKCNGKMSISGISKKVFKEEETHCCEGGCKCVDWIGAYCFIIVIIIASHMTSNTPFSGVFSFNRLAWEVRCNVCA